MTKMLWIKQWENLNFTYMMQFLTNFIVFIVLFKMSFLDFCDNLVNLICITLLYTVDGSSAEKQQSKTKTTAMQNGGATVNDPSSSSPSPRLEPTWIHQIFQGTFTSETRCLNCETVVTHLVCFIFNRHSFVYYRIVPPFIADCCQVTELVMICKS